MNEEPHENRCKITRSCEHHAPSKLCALFTIGGIKGICKHFNNYQCKNKNAYLNAIAEDLKALGFVITKGVLQDLESRCKWSANDFDNEWIDTGCNHAVRIEIDYDHDEFFKYCSFCGKLIERINNTESKV